VRTERPAARPRQAASLILIRPGREGAEVLIGRRAAASRFMPGRYVFPGGAVHAEDRRPWPGETGSPARLGDEPRHLRLARAALRETGEETGLILARSEGAACASATGRHALSPIENAIAQRRLRPDFALLAYLGRAITPTSSPIRFHARFFLGDGRDAVGEPVGNGELEDLGWRPVAAALAHDLSDVTRFMLAHALAVWRGATIATPLYRYVSAAIRISGAAGR
jgi:8-oxo-dGTP pyrophosphatase MutT (NUDIX family)